MPARIPRTDTEWTAIIATALATAQAEIAATPGKKYPVPAPGSKAFAKLIDHTLLKPDADEEGVRRLCGEAREWGFKTVCIRPPFVPTAKAALAGSDVLICSVVCFPEGTQSTEEKIAEGKSAVAAGASELDFVIPVPALLARSYVSIHAQLITIRRAFPSPLTVKIILETSQLTAHDIVAGCLLAEEAGFDFVKTSTGFRGGGATVEDVRLMREVVGVGVGVKASGGVRGWEGARGMVEGGAGRLGVSAGVGIMEEGVRVGGGGGAAAAAAGGGDGGY